MLREIYTYQLADDKADPPCKPTHAGNMLDMTARPATGPSASRHNSLDTHGVIHLTRDLRFSLRSRGRISRKRALNARRSSRRNGARPAATATNGSSGATLVHVTGNERVRPLGPTYMTRSSPQLNRYVSSSNVCPCKGWNGWVTVKTAGRCASRGAMRGFFQRVRRTVRSVDQRGMSRSCGPTR